MTLLSKKIEVHHQNLFYSKPPKLSKVGRLINPMSRVCIIINPGPIAEELITDSYISQNFSFEFIYTDVLHEDDVIEKISNKHPSQIILIDFSSKICLSNYLIENLAKLKINQKKKIFSVVSFYETETGKVAVGHLKRDWLNDQDLFFFNTQKNFFLFKYFFDLIITICFLPVCLFLVSIGMLLIKLSSKGPVMFKQMRVGKDGKPFMIYKLRTMIYNPSGDNRFTVKNDNRVFAVGKILRKTKIDELPQLYNVLVGEMSLIGPRPERVDIVKKMTDENPFYPFRHLVKPGISGWAQVNHPTATPNENLIKLEYDLFYIKHASFLIDIKILWRTLKVIVSLNSL